MTIPCPAALAALRARAGVEPAAVRPELFEHWLKRERWHARSEAVPLVVGVAPAEWSRLREEASAVAEGDALWQSFAAVLGCSELEDPAVAPFRVREWARRDGFELPAALERLLDFIGSVLAPSADPTGAAGDGRAGDRAVILGAALALVTRDPTSCTAPDGAFDAALIARQIFRQAVDWFPLAPPALSEQEAAGLIAGYLPVSQ